jgi:hypothetical protein
VASRANDRLAKMMNDPELRKAMGGLQQAMQHAGSAANVFWDVDQTGATLGPAQSAPLAEARKHTVQEHGAAESDMPKEHASMPKEDASLVPHAAPFPPRLPPHTWSE